MQFNKNAYTAFPLDLRKVGDGAKKVRVFQYFLVYLPKRMAGRRVKSNTVITPNLGIVKYIGSMWTTLSRDSYHYTVWELKDYHIAK